MIVLVVCVVFGAVVVVVVVSLIGAAVDKFVRKIVEFESCIVELLVTGSTVTNGVSGVVEVVLVIELTLDPRGVVVVMVGRAIFVVVVSRGATRIRGFEGSIETVKVDGMDETPCVVSVKN